MQRTNESKLASNYTGFFEKLCKNLRRIGEAFSQYTDPEENTKELPASVRLRRTLLCVYTDLFSFYRLVIRVFRKPDGGKVLKIHREDHS